MYLFRSRYPEYPVWSPLASSIVRTFYCLCLSLIAAFGRSACTATLVAPISRPAPSVPLAVPPLVIGRPVSSFPDDDDQPALGGHRCSLAAPL